MSASSLNCTTQPVRLRPRRSRHYLKLTLTGLLGAVLLPLAANAQVRATPQFSAQNAGPQTLCQAQVIGNRRIPKESVLQRLFSRPGDQYDPAVVERDFNSLWNTGYFDNVRIEKLDDTQHNCVQLLVYVTEKATIRELNYVGLSSITVSDVTDRLKKEKVGLTQESQLDYPKVQRAVNVIKQMLGEHGHQFATVRYEIKRIPPANVAITFRIKEGPTVKVGKIEFTGNDHVPAHDLRAAMTNLKPIGIPHSIFLENIFPRTYDASKLDEDADRVRNAYRERGYARANTGEPQTNVRNAGGINPLTLRPSTGKRVDILIPVEEGERYRLGGITFSGYKLLNNTKAFRAQFPIKDGDWFNARLFGKGTEALRKAYGANGFINMVGTPIPTCPANAGPTCQGGFDDTKKLVYLNIEIDEGKKFYISRIEFTGNTLTRDRVIRRELMIEEGQPYNSQAVDYSLQRLNQLNYFETLKTEEDVETRQNADAGTVDLLIKLKEKGKNSIGLNGGISGLSGSFLGLNYETNNFLGLGETLSLNANIGDLSRNVSIGFTEPYLRNKPVSLGIQVFASKYDYNPAKSYAIANGQSANLTNAQSSLLTNYNQSSTGVTLSTSTPLRNFLRNRGVARVGISYQLSKSSISTFNDNTRNVFETLAFRSGIAGQNQLSGIISSIITPSFSFSTLDQAVGPHHGKDFNVVFQFAGFGGNTKFYAPSASYRQFWPMKGLKISSEGHNVLAFRTQVSNVAGYGGQVAPPFQRIYGGGENDVRGFDIRASSPYTFIPTRVNFQLTNPDGSPVPRDTTNPSLGNVEIPIPVYRLSSIGGDTGLTSNLEYRIPIVSQVTFDFFADFGLTFDTQKSQLRQSVEGQSLLNAPSYGCPTVVNGNCFGGQQVQFPLTLPTVPGTNFVPRMSIGPELTVVLPIVNAPLRIFYAYNPLRLYKDLPQQFAVPEYCAPGQTLCLKNMFPSDGAGLYSFAQAVQFYGANYQLREPRKTFRLTVSTTF